MFSSDKHIVLKPSLIRHRPRKPGEPTEVALKCLVEKIGLPEYTAMPSALDRLRPSERVQFCNHRWEVELKKIFTLEFSRDRKMMSVLVENLAFQVTLGAYFPLPDLHVDPDLDLYDKANDCLVHWPLVCNRNLMTTGTSLFLQRVHQRT